MSAVGINQCDSTGGSDVVQISLSDSSIINFKSVSL